MSGHISSRGLALEGHKTPIWSKPGNLNNSELTIKPKKRSAGDHESSLQGRRHAQRPLTTSTLSDLGGTFNCSLSNIQAGDTMLRKSVTFNEDTLKDGILESSDGWRDLNDSGVGSLNGTSMRVSHDETPWFTRQDHHLFTSPSGAEFGVAEAPLGTLGAAVASSLNLDDQAAIGVHGSLATLAREFFPLTLSADTFAKSVDAPLQTNLVRPSYTSRGLPRPGSASSTLSRKPKRSKSPTRAKSARRPAAPSGTATPTGLASQSLEKMYLRSVEAPVTAMASVVSITPFQAELARLRMERLQLEEKHLLEVKRQDELERIRGPQPKWYELKTPEFHYEAHKNTELIRSESEWQALLDYRTQLLSASKDFQRTYGSST